MPKILVNGANLHYRQTGAGPDFIMLHGLGGNLAVWHFALAAKLRDSFQITTYDLRGHGRSDLMPNGYTTRNMAQDLHDLMGALQIEKAHLLGHSFGADIALHFALLYPERVNKLIVIDAMLPVMLQSYKRPDWDGWAYWAKLLKQVSGIKVPRERWDDIPFMMKHSFEVPVLFGPFRGRARNKEPITKLLTETSIVQDFDVIDELTVENFAKITPQTLLIYDAKTPFYETFEALRQGLPNATYVLLPESELRHFSPLEQPDLILKHTRAFLQVEASLAEDGVQRI